MGLLLLKVEWINSTPQIYFCPDPAVDEENGRVEDKIIEEQIVPFCSSLIILAGKGF